MSPLSKKVNVLIDLLRLFSVNLKLFTIRLSLTRLFVNKLTKLTIVGDYISMRRYFS